MPPFGQIIGARKKRANARRNNSSKQRKSARSSNCANFNKS